MIVLTGGAGFIGSCMLATLNASGYTDVLIVDSLRSGDKWKNLVGHSFLDIVSKENFREMMMTGVDEGIETLIHFGACSTTTERDADYLYDNNTRYSQEVAEFAFRQGARLIYASSAATYGDGSKGYSDDERLLLPLNMYGYSKYLFDEWVRSNGYDGSCVGLKFFNVYGPNEYHKIDQASMIYKAVQQIAQTGSVKLFASNDPQYPDGGQMRDFIYVKDACKVVMWLMKSPQINGIFNFGSGTARTWNDAARAVFAAMELEPHIEYIEMPKELKLQYQNFTQAQMSKLRNYIPTMSFSTLEEGVADYVKNHLVQSWQYY
ncbi:MAG: ADP-glyceromanno-heptose 6-epimerase [Ignavibacteria bacterium]|nr:ADP-glyceromanno-heptose 6-epimerase [Ignavibacteria bacterium]